MLDATLSRLIHRRAHIKGPLVLMYHSVADAGPLRPEWPWAVSRQRFREQLDFLRDAGWLTCTQAELATGGPSHGERTVAITFDDGYADNHGACDDLLRRDMKASWFVVSGSVGQPPRWQDPDQPRLRILDAGQLRDMHAAGMEIGSHTVSHARLPTLDDAALARELTDSRAALEDLLGAPVTGLAYPYGLYDERCRTAARDAGYRHASTTQSGWALLDKDPFLVRRLTVYNADTAATLARKLAYAANDVAWSHLLGERAARFLHR